VQNFYVILVLDINNLNYLYTYLVTTTATSLGLVFMVITGKAWVPGKANTQQINLLVCVT